MEGELKHFSHKHPLILKAEECKIDDGTHHPDMKVISCDGCLTPISGPSYSCRECRYYLHKECAELPKILNNQSMHTHPLTLLSSPPNRGGVFWCHICREMGRRFVYHCSRCEFYVDTICASASNAIEDKCHQHPLIPMQLPLSFPCHICRTEEKGMSYKCNICQFCVHNDCMASLQIIAKHSDHFHPLNLLQSLPQKYSKFIYFCDICYRRLNRVSSFECIYCCEECWFFAHVSCVRSEESLEGLALLPLKQKPTNLISWFAENFSDRDAITNLILGFDESFINRDNNIKKEIKLSYHEHPLILIDDQECEVICDACALPISTPSYGCNDCGYFLHECCTELPKQILHPAHPQHQISLWPCNRNFIGQLCKCCYQWSNGFFYKCLQCETFYIDIKCASLLRLVKHEAHRHPLIPRFELSRTCHACGLPRKGILQCTKCSFELCFRCAMAPPEMKHRYDKHPFILKYSSSKLHSEECEYICDLCEEDLNPKYWFYHCSLCDQFAHTYCMLWRGGDSNVKYGKSYKYEEHEHELALVPCTRSGSFCNTCRLPMRTGYSIGLECKPCNFRIHVLCALDIITSLPN